jgi:FixJ family two-component response regulator
VLIDLSLAGISAAQLSQMMLNSNPAVRLILMSGYPFDTTKLLDDGRDRMAFLHKPFTPAMLAETVDRMIGSATGR